MNQAKVQTRRVKIETEFNVPIKHLEIRVTRKLGDGEWMIILRGLYPFDLNLVQQPNHVYKIAVPPTA